jgi:hypothetical protein
MSLFMLAAHSARQSQTTTADFTGFLEVGVGLPFLEIEGKRRLIRRASRAVVCAQVPDAVLWLAPSSPSPAINSPCEEGCCSPRL